jgi:hypothetical protein
MRHLLEVMKQSSGLSIIVTNRAGGSKQRRLIPKRIRMQ